MPRRVETLYVPDLHVPAHSPRAVDEVVKFARAERPRQIILLGDVPEAYGLSRFGQSIALAQKYSPEKELREVEAVVRRFRALAPTAWLAGNHEQRHEKRLAERPLQAPYYSSPYAAIAKRLGVDYRRRGCMMVDPELRVCHGDGGGMPARAIGKARRTGLSIVQGHTHALRLEWLGQDWFALEAGHLLDHTQEAFEYSDGAAEGVNAWRAGFAWLGLDGRPRLEAL